MLLVPAQVPPETSSRLSSVPSAGLQSRPFGRGRRVPVRSSTCGAPTREKRASGLRSLTSRLRGFGVPIRICCRHDVVLAAEASVNWAFRERDATNRRLAEMRNTGRLGRSKGGEERVIFHVARRMTSVVCRRED
ncbi:hypothetical protein CTRI78_v001517 [Colletotrichum trifolii]|uniref:Uncharacterized protein n=1 Tax=Colletotrichum trifolii TaxID=5466 RepID=A0A4R8RNZ5_COLTR|nr:hypothetical protein CTRI78_v001517 [Colletotrichum trifolii]